MGDCGCRVRMATSGAARTVAFCPLHEAAPALLKALEGYEGQHNRSAPSGRCACDDCNVAREAIREVKDIPRGFTTRHCQIAVPEEAKGEVHD